MFSKILVPVDFTPKNSPALKAALQIAAQSEAEVTLLHIIEKVDYLPAAELKGFYERLEKNARLKMEALIKKLRPYKTVLRDEIIYGKRAQEIVRYAAKGRHDLIILSSHKITAAEMAPGAGTVSYRVAILAQCPVLLVK